MAGVIGWPAHFSLSPKLHNAAYEAMGLDNIYVALPVEPNYISTAVGALRALNMLGASVTFPYKEAVIDHLDSWSEIAQQLQAVNTIHNKDGQLRGDNTDGPGFVRALASNGFEVAGSRCVVFGAGGAARAVVAGLAQAQATDIAIINRSPERLARAVQLTPVARAGSYEDIAEASLIVNGTSLGMGDDNQLAFDTSGITSRHFVADLVYHPLQTRLLREAAHKGARTMNGLAMLVYQAALQIELWTGQCPPIDVMFKAIE